MSTYPNYRVSVELIIKKDNKILVGKRSTSTDVNPGNWSFPAGKVKYNEIPKDAVLREAKEETAFDVKIISELNCRTATIKRGEEDAYRLMYTYLVEPQGEQELILNDEHSEFKWLSKEDLFSEEYKQFLPKHTSIFMDQIFD
ncbi:MAG: NUDIX hydrolase [Proteobacteria bacterium]|nr:NUDIX hydrolase [Pseudomonadota bacterium]